VCPQVMEFCESVPGLAFLHGFVRAFHVGCVKMGVCGLRLVGLWFEMTGLHWLVGVSFGTQQQIKHGIEEAMVAYTRTETPPMAQPMPPQETTGTLDLTQARVLRCDVFQRSSVHVEGRNGYLALRNHALRGLDNSRTRPCLTVVHNFLLKRPDGATAAERFFGQKPQVLFAAILESVEVSPAPLSPPRRAAG
jgi:uncharacterized protein DUF6399